MPTAIEIYNNHISENFSVSLLVLLSVRCCDSFLRITECSTFLLEKIMHPQHHTEAGKVRTGSTSSMKYPSIVNTLPLQRMGDDKYSPKIKRSRSLFHNLPKLLRRDVSVITPSYGKGSWGTKLWKDLIRNIQELIRKARNPDIQAILSPTIGLVSQAPDDIEDREREGKARQSTEGFWTSHLSLCSCPPLSSHIIQWEYPRHTQSCSVQELNAIFRCL